MDELASTCDTRNCSLHFHANDSIFTNEEIPQVAQVLLENQEAISSQGHTSESAIAAKRGNLKDGQRGVKHKNGPKESGFTRIIRNFTPS
jgi:hypothetical protein